MSSPYLVALQGFSAFERSALGSCFRLATKRTPAYAQGSTIDECQFVIADADHPGTVQAVLQAGRVDDTVFIGARAPDGASAWMMRPIDPLHVMRELDAMVATRFVERPALRASAGITAPRPQARVPVDGPVPARRASDDVGFVPLGGTRASDQPHTAARGHEALLVDDSDIALRFLETRLQRQGLRTQRASTSARALELMAQRRFDFVFLDVELGVDSDLDGLALCQHIKRQHRPARDGGPPVVAMVSAHRGELDRVRGMLAGCDAYLAKPLDGAALRRLLLQHGVPLPAASDGMPAL